MTPFFISYFCSLSSKRSCSKEELPNDFPQTGRAKVGVRDWGKACKKTPYFWKTRSSTNGGFWLVRHSHNDWQVTHFRAKYYLLVVAWQRQWRKMWTVLNRVLMSESGLGFKLKREQELSMRHLFKGALSRNFRQFQHWLNGHRINWNNKITAQDYRRTQTKHRKAKKGQGWTKLGRIEMDCIWVNLNNVGPPFFKS